eukprot:CAMPEP_0185181052 /NCGR_PEP_ID=MMETSP1139-20130426/32815_1 /TAXON_ID=298111 /ORGANISM="Pavlova sp., Strain CCMP459" /LENGTH=163 /DNA_ID=CAMNT_0027746887 /DNA_START=367 /DNA_END=858 /DNA_ORIENTATION=-
MSHEPRFHGPLDRSREARQREPHLGEEHCCPELAGNAQSWTADMPVFVGSSFSASVQVACTGVSCHLQGRHAQCDEAVIATFIPRARALSHWARRLAWRGLAFQPQLDCHTVQCAAQAGLRPSGMPPHLALKLLLVYRGVVTTTPRKKDQSLQDVALPAERGP